MWSFVNTLGSHSLHTKLKTHYSEQLHSYNNPLLNLVHSEHLPQVDVQIHIMVVLKKHRVVGYKHIMRWRREPIPAVNVLPLNHAT